MIAISLHHVTKKYKIKQTGPKNKFFKEKKEKIVIDDVSLDIKKGEVVGIIGRNGAGKSTLLSLIAKILEPDTGKIMCDGKVTSILELGMGFHHEMSGRENILLKGRMYGFSDREIHVIMPDIIEYSGIEDSIDEPIRTYSSGMIARLAFSIMVHAQSEIMLVDEILSVGDAGFVSKAKEHFKKMSKELKTIIFVSHSISDIETMCTRAIWVEKGKIKMDGDAHIVCSEYRNAISESPEILLDLSESGVADAQYKVAHLYKDGVSFPKDLKKYEQLLKKSSDQNYVPAQLEYARLLMERGDSESAIVIYQHASSKGSAEANYKLAELISETSLKDLDKHVTKNTCISDTDLLNYAEFCSNHETDDCLKEAFEIYFELAKERAYGHIQLANAYKNGLGTKKDNDEYIAYLKKASDFGNLNAKFQLAEMYYYGRFVERNLEHSFKLFLSCAKLGHTKSQFLVANMLYMGEGTLEDKKMAEKWYATYSRSKYLKYFLWAGDLKKTIRKLTPDDANTFYISNIDSANINILNNIVQMYANGQLNDRSEYDRAMEVLTNIAENGDVVAIRKLYTYFNEGVGVEADPERATYWLTKGDCLGDTWSQIRLGECYRDGIGVPKDFSKAKDLFMKCVNQRNIQSISNIVQMYANGQLNDRSEYDRAMEVLTNIAENGDVVAIRKLYTYFNEGVGVEADPERATYWYEKIQ